MSEAGEFLFSFEEWKRATDSGGLSFFFGFNFFLLTRTLNDEIFGLCKTSNLLLYSNLFYSPAERYKIQSVILDIGVSVMSNM